MNVKQCGLCGIQWINGVPYWSHGNKPTTNANVAAIVCKHAKPRDGLVCANPCGNNDAGCTDSWDIRQSQAEKIEFGLQRVVPQTEENKDVYEKYEAIFEEYGEGTPGDCPKGVDGNNP